MDEITNLVNVLKPQIKNYKERQIKSAILAEGYSEEIANKVIAELFKQEPQKTNNPIKEEIKENTNKKDYYSEVDKLLDELRKTNNITNTLEIPKPNILESEPKIMPNRRIVGDNNNLEDKKKELDSIIIESGDEDKIVLNDGKIINLEDYPRRDWRTYRDQGKTLAQIKNEKKEALRKEIYELKRNSPETNSNTKEDISDMIFNQLKEKNVDVSDIKVRTATREEANRLRDEYKEKQIEKKELDLAVENILTQYEKEPNAENNKLGEKKEIKQEQKTNSNLDMDLGNDFNLNMDSESNTNNDNNEFDLGLDLNLDDKKKEKKK